MLKSQDVGIYGKLPAHGDFIYRELPSQFINKWDEWLQGFMATSKDELGDQWLDVYLTSPIWRFAFTDGIIDANHWAGVMIPSVDRVGRYFPFTIAVKIPQATTVFNILQNNQWFSDIESLGMKALTGNIKIDQLIEELNAVKISTAKTSRLDTRFNEESFVMEFDESVTSLGKALPVMLDGLLRAKFTTYSIWSTALGSNLISPLVAASRGLPGLRNTTALLDGNWAGSNWSMLSGIRVQTSLQDESTEA